MRWEASKGVFIKGTVCSDMRMIDGNRERKDRVRVPRDEPPGMRLVGMVRFLLYGN